MHNLLQTISTIVNETTQSRFFTCGWKSGFCGTCWI